MSNIICFSGAGDLPFSPSPFLNLGRYAPDPADPHDVQLVTARLKEICFEAAHLTRQLDDPCPHCPKNITQRIVECAACQKGEPGHVSDLVAHQELLFRRIQELEVEKDQCRRFLTEAHRI